MCEKLSDLPANQHAAQHVINSNTEQSMLRLGREGASWERAAEQARAALELDEENLPPACLTMLRSACENAGLLATAS